MLLPAVVAAAFLPQSPIAIADNITSVAAPAAISAAAPAAVSVAGQRPNIVLISTDDQASYDLRWMPKTRKLLANQGYTFGEGLSPHPLCCPARAEWLTGQYGQNNGVHHNSGEFGGYKALVEPDNTVASWLQADGYQTAMSGKFLNGYHPTTSGIPAGWDLFNPMYLRYQKYRNSIFWHDGAPAAFPGHSDDGTTKFSVEQINQMSQNPDPFFLWVSYFAPHSAVGVKNWPQNWAKPADRHQGMFPTAQPPILNHPSWNEQDVSDQIPVAQQADKKPLSVIAPWFRSRIQSLQAVDEGVAKIVTALSAQGQLDNTYLIFTSDNGYLLGEHRLTKKNYLYYEALQVPFLVRTPADDGATVSSIPVTSVDIAPTIAELAGITPSRTVDGESFAPLLQGQALAWRDTQLIQTGRSAADGWDTRGVLTSRYTYGELYDGFVQLYDHNFDPYEVNNVADDPRYQNVIAELRNRVRTLTQCAGTECSQTFGPAPAPAPSRP
jgi:N-acetylglucosamine-6-sulfatase